MKSHDKSIYIKTIEPVLMRCVILNVFEYEPGEEREANIEQAMASRDNSYIYKN
jgi:hypothetical protein